MRQFINELIRRGRLARLQPRDMTIFNVDGSYGHYQVKIGPVDRKTHHRAIEINGNIHHLFVTRDKVEPLPTHKDIDNNMRGTVIMNDISIHLFDSEGDGDAVKIEHANIDGVHPCKLINLAGEKGEELLHKFEVTGRLANETYHIVQEDILNSLKAA